MIITLKFPQNPGKFKFSSIQNLNLIYVYEEDFALLNYSGLEACFIFLDDRFFKKKKVCLFEKILRSYWHAYYFNEASGLHYDQLEIFKEEKRILFSCPHQLNFKKVPLQRHGINFSPYHSRALDWYGLEGDFLTKHKSVLSELDF